MNFANIIEIDFQIKTLEISRHLSQLKPKHRNLVENETKYNFNSR